MPLLFPDGRVRVVEHLGVALDRRHAFSGTADALADGAISRCSFTSDTRIAARDELRGPDEQSDQESQDNHSAEDWADEAANCSQRRKKIMKSRFENASQYADHGLDEKERQRADDDELQESIEHTRLSR